MGRRTLSDLAIAKLKPRAARYAIPDPELRGHYVRVMPSGRSSFVAVARDPRGKQIWSTINATDAMSVADAREKAREIIQRVRAGQTPTPSIPDSFGAVAEEWFKRHVLAKGLRSQHEVRRFLSKNLLPGWGNLQFVAIRRSDVAKMLDRIEDNNGARQADYALAIIRGIANWYAARHEDYFSPVVKGMRRTKPAERARKRVLDDDEIRALWKHAEGGGTFGGIVCLLLLTGQRREKVASMRWDDLSRDGEWLIQTEPREKGTGGTLVLPDLALKVIKEQPRFATNSFVFAGRGEDHFKGYSPCKRAFDAKLKIDPWVLHDLRRTARSLMSRAGVRPDVAERVLGHAIAGVEGVYDRHQYRAEKAEALKKLAALIAAILKPTSDNVVRLRKARS